MFLVQFKRFVQIGEYDFTTITEQKLFNGDEKISEIKDWIKLKSKYDGLITTDSDLRITEPE